MIVPCLAEVDKWLTQIDILPPFCGGRFYPNRPTRASRPHARRGPGGRWRCGRVSDGETTALTREVGTVSFLTSVQVGAILALQAKKCLAAVAEP